MKPILEVKNLSKRYFIIKNRNTDLNLRETLVNRFKGLVSSSKANEFWALKGLDFEVFSGETIGVIGRNGSGKSTLLKVISRITPPTKGQVILRGRVASLLEVGTGFHSELTGRENIFLNGAILGLKRIEILNRFDEIVEFSGVEQFLDTPLKHYSSGMQLRLAFSVAAHLEPEILIVDEVLAVGDAAFQRKCLNKMQSVSRQDGRTVIFVSHNMGVISSLCKKAIYLSDGEIKLFTDTPTVIDAYVSSTQDVLSLDNFSFEGPLCEQVQLRKIFINDSNPLEKSIIISQLNPISFKIMLRTDFTKPFRITLSVFKNNIRIFSLHDVKFQKSPSGDITSTFIIPEKVLRPGNYSLAIGGHVDHEKGDWFWKESICFFEISEVWDIDIEPINIGLINIKATTNRILA